MPATRLHHRHRALRRLAAAAALVVAGGGLAATATSSADAAGLQQVRFSVSTDGPAFTSTTVRADFTLTNPSTNTGSVAAFSIVVPPGLSAVAGAGVTGPGNWRESVLPCGSVAPCSALVLVYASLPLRSSVLAPGLSLTASVTFTAPAQPGSFAFKMIGIGNGLFVTPDTPTVAVVSGTPASFLVTDPALGSPGSTEAGTAQTFAVQARSSGGLNVPYGPAQVRVELGADDPFPATLQLGAGSPVAFAPLLNPVTNQTRYAVLLTLPGTSSGLYSLTITFFTAASPTSVTVSDTAVPTVNGELSGFSVVPGPPTSVTLDSVKDGSVVPPAAPLPNPVAGEALVASFHLNDAYGNPTTLHASGLALAAGGPGTLGPQTVVDTNPATNPPTLGTVTTSYSTPTPPIGFTLNLTNPSATSNTVSSAVDGSGQVAILTPGQPGGFTSPSCLLSSTDPVCSTANLPQGANGQVNLVQQVCDSTDTIPVCLDNPGAPVITSVLGDLSTLYTRAHPASMTIHCLAAVCEDPDGDKITDPNTAEEIREIIAAFPGHAKTSLVPVGGPTPVYETLVACLVPSKKNPNVIPSTKQFCSDHRSYAFDAQGNVSFTIYYLTDPKGGP